MKTYIHDYRYHISYNVNCRTLRDSLEMIPSHETMSVRPTEAFNLDSAEYQGEFEDVRQSV